MKLFRIALLIVLALLSASAMANPGKSYHFKVFLDDKEIGHHRFVVTPNRSQTYVRSEARFDVKFLFITAYTYLHNNSEVWQGDCLQIIHASTDDNGEKLYVHGEYKEKHLQLHTHSGHQQVEGCIRTFAYWDPDLLNSKYLLNAQTGEMVSVEIELLEESIITVRGQLVKARHYRINNHELNIDLWYSKNDEWLALESTTEGGARLRYLIQ